jgi:hypothetical protein
MGEAGATDVSMPRSLPRGCTSVFTHRSVPQYVVGGVCGVDTTFWYPTRLDRSLTATQEIETLVIRGIRAQNTECVFFLFGPISV